MSIPENLKYTNDHEWVSVDGNVATVGITSFAINELGDVVFVEAEEGELSKGDVFGSIEAVKTVADMFMPISGEVIEFNEKLEDTPELINNDPYGEGWIIKIEMSDTTELDDLLDHAAYSALV